MSFDERYEASPRDGSGRAIGRWLVVGLLAALAGTAVYVYAVRTITGQTIENAALQGADQIGADASLRADDFLSQMTVGSLLVVTVVVAAIGLLRGRPTLALAGVAIVFLGQALTQPLKLILPRPELFDPSGAPVHNSFPSGHTTIATTLACAAILMVPYRMRGVVGIVAVTAAAGVSAYTVVAKWHRLSDTLGANAIAVTAACIVCVALVSFGGQRMRVVAGGAYPIRSVVVGIAGLAAALISAAALVIILRAWDRPTLDYVASDRFLLGSQLLAATGTVLAILVFWGTLYRLDLMPRVTRSAGDRSHRRSSH